jgi:hypothetical protein
VLRYLRDCARLARREPGRRVVGVVRAGGKALALGSSAAGGRRRARARAQGRKKDAPNSSAIVLRRLSEPASWAISTGAAAWAAPAAAVSVARAEAAAAAAATGLACFERWGEEGRRGESEGRRQRRAAAAAARPRRAAEIQRSGGAGAAARPNVGAWGAQQGARGPNRRREEGKGARACAGVVGGREARASASAPLSAIARPLCGRGRLIRVRREIRAAIAPILGPAAPKRRARAQRGRLSGRWGAGARLGGAKEERTLCSLARALSLSLSLSLSPRKETDLRRDADRRLARRAEGRHGHHRAGHRPGGERLLAAESH